MRVYWLPIVAVLTTFTSVAAAAVSPEAGTPVWREALTLAGLLALGLGTAAVLVLLYLFFAGLFLHMAARLAGLRRPFGTAIWALLVSFLFHVLAGVLLAFAAPAVPGAALAASWLATTLAIMLVYETSFLRALLSAVLTVVLSVAATLAALVLAAILFGTSFPAQAPSAPAPEVPHETFRI